MAVVAKLLYIQDPMCSWCWGYQPTLNRLAKHLDPRVELVYLVGGLAPDSDQPMPLEMQQFLQQTWRKIEQQLNRPFNHEYWQLCKPRRSTYPACRAVLAARKQQAEYAMITAIQEAYYLQAQNPSDNRTLVALAKDLGLDTQQFVKDLESEGLNQQLLAEINYSRSMPISGFPSLILVTSQDNVAIPLDYQDHKLSLDAVAQYLA